MALYCPFDVIVYDDGPGDVPDATFVHVDPINFWMAHVPAQDTQTMFMVQPAWPTPMAALQPTSQFVPERHTSFAQ